MYNSARVWVASAVIAPVIVRTSCPLIQACIVAPFGSLAVAHRQLNFDVEPLPDRQGYRAHRALVDVSL